MLCLTQRTHGSVANLTWHFSSWYDNCSVWWAPNHSSLSHSKWQHIRKGATHACSVSLLADLRKRIIAVYQFTVLSALIPMEVQHVTKDHKTLKLPYLYSFSFYSPIQKKRTPEIIYCSMNVSQNSPKYNGWTAASQAVEFNSLPWFHLVYVHLMQFFQTYNTHTHFQMPHPEGRVPGQSAGQAKQRSYGSIFQDGP